MKKGLLRRGVLLKRRPVFVAIVGIVIFLLGAFETDLGWINFLLCFHLEGI